MKNSVKINKQSKWAIANRLPKVAYTRSGLAFEPNEDKWSWVDGVFRVHLDFTRVRVASNFPIHSLKYTLHVFFKLNAPTYASNLFNAFVHLISLRDETHLLETVSVVEVSNYAARLGPHHKWRLTFINALIQKWNALGLPGVEPECAQYLRERRKPGNVKGAAVLLRDPVVGPLSDEEFNNLYKAVDTGYGTGAVPLWCIVLYRLLCVTGGRISQYASLKIEDVVETDGKFLVRLPQVKKGAEHSRVIFQEFDLSPQTGRLLMDYIKGLLAKNRNDDAPLFPATEVMPSGPRQEFRDKSNLFSGHCTRDQLSYRFKHLVSEVAPPTTRLDFEKTPVAPKRFRPSFATRLVDEGANRAVVAHLLGHSDLQNVDVYFEQSETGLANMNRALEPYLAPVARCFQGRIIDGKEYAAEQDGGNGLIIDFRVSKQRLASCAGKTKSCAFDKPVACYTCFRFEPWLDGPHEAVLSRLEAERSKWSADPKMAAINDASIIAVKEVIAECALIRQQRAEGQE